MLQRIYATAWKAPDQLKAYKKMLVEAKKRDHRVLGKRLDLFAIQVSLVQIICHLERNRNAPHCADWIFADSLSS